MSTTDLAIEINHPHAHGATGYHHIEESVAVYLHASPDGTSWGICDSATDGHALDSNYDRGPLIESCECDDTDTCRAWVATLRKQPLPDAEQLLHLLADALGYHLVPRAAATGDA
jgi:hypothetical protein